MKLIFYLLDCVSLTSKHTPTLNLRLKIIIKNSNYCTVWQKLRCIDVRMPSNAIRIPSRLLTRGGGGESPNHATGRAGLQASALLKLCRAPPFNSCNAFINTCVNFAHLRHSPKPVRLNSKELQRLCNSVWRGKPRSAVDSSVYTRISLGPKTFPPWAGTHYRKCLLRCCLPYMISTG